MKLLSNEINNQKLAQILDTQLTNPFTKDTVNLIDEALYENSYMMELSSGFEKTELLKEKVFLERTRNQIEHVLLMQETNDEFLDPMTLIA